MATVLSRSRATTTLAAAAKDRVLVDPRAVFGKRQRRRVVPRSLQRLVGPVLLVALWQILSTPGGFDERTVPPPTRVVSVGFRRIAEGALHEHRFTRLLRVG